MSCGEKKAAKGSMRKENGENELWRKKAAKGSVKKEGCENELWRKEGGERQHEKRERRK